MKIYFIIILFLTEFTIININAQQEIKLQHFSIQEGLSQSTVNDIFQDHLGYIWIGTYNGLNKFDGQKFTVYTNVINETLSINTSFIYKVFEDEKNRLWIGTTYGISLFNRNKNNFKNYTYSNNEYSCTPVRAIVETNNKDELFLGTASGIYLFSVLDEKFTHFTLNESIYEANSVMALLKDKKGLYWAAIEKRGIQVFEFSNHNLLEKSELSLLFKQVSKINIQCIKEDFEGNIWLGSEEGQLYKYSPENNTVTKYGIQAKGEFGIVSIIEDKKGRLWIGTDKHGLFIFNPNSGLFSPLKYKAEPGNKIILSLFEDKKGNIWIGTIGGGVYLYDELDERFNFVIPYDINDNMDISNSILSICKDNYSQMWLGTDGGGLIRYSSDGIKEKIINSENNPELSVNTVLNVFHSSDDKIYIGTYLGGLYTYDLKNDQIQKFSNKWKNKIMIDDNIIWKTFEDIDHNLWIATNIAGLIFYDRKNQSFKQYIHDIKNPNSISANSVRAIFQDSKQNLWIGTVYGLDKFNSDDSSFTNYTHDPLNQSSIANSNILTIYEGTDHKIYIGTLGGGVSIYNHNENNFTHITEKEGLISNMTYGILEDGQGNFWISTDKGLSRYNPGSKTIINFNSENGLYSSQFNLGAAYKDKLGKMYFGTNNGLCIFEPSFVKQNYYIPPVFITGFLLFNEQVKIGIDKPLKKDITVTDTIILNYDQNFISFEFAALNFTHPANNKYAYKLEPIEEEWNYNGDNRTASYINLAPGKYTFWVKGSNNDQQWNDMPTKLQLIINPPYWKTIWFKGICTTLITLIIIIAYKIKIRQIKKQKQTLERLVVQRTQEIEIKNRMLVDIEKKNADLIQQQLNSEILYKSEELSKTTLQIIQKNRLLDDLKKKLKLTIRNPKTFNLDYYRKVLWTININYSPLNEWKEFDANFDKVHQNFTQKLTAKFFDLSTNDLRLCALYLINIPTKEIASILGISLDSVKKGKVSVKEKIIASSR